MEKIYVKCIDSGDSKSLKESHTYLVTPFIRTNSGPVLYQSGIPFERATHVFVHQDFNRRRMGYMMRADRFQLISNVHRTRDSKELKKWARENFYTEFTLGKIDEALINPIILKEWKMMEETNNWALKLRNFLRNDKDMTSCSVKIKKPNHFKLYMMYGAWSFSWVIKLGKTTHKVSLKTPYIESWWSLDRSPEKVSAQIITFLNNIITFLNNTP